MSAEEQQEQETVHMTCRAKHPITGDANCPGTEAIIKSKRRDRSQIASGGTHYVTYVCTTCKRPWTIGF